MLCGESWRDRREEGVRSRRICAQMAGASMSLAAMQDGKQMTTIEGLERDGTLHPLQAAFIEHDPLQCGFCTSS
jgi:xanthine dehydrogenase YagT iron-sulfur-binding subunit